MSEPRGEIRETLDFVSVINTALTDVYYSRAKITWSRIRPELEEQVYRYLSAVTALVNLVTPVLGFRPDLSRAEEAVRAGRYLSAVRLLDGVVTDLISRLHEAGLLVRSERGVRVGVVYTDKEESEE